MNRNKIIFTVLLLLVFFIPLEIDVRNYGVDIPLVNTSLEIITVILLAVWLAGKVIKRDLKLPGTPFDIQLIILLGLHFICSITAGGDFAWAFRVSLKFMLNVLLFYMIIDIVRRKEQFRSISTVLIITAIIVALFGIFERVLPGMTKGIVSIFSSESFRLTGSETLRIKATFAYPNIFAMFLEMALLLLIGKSINVRVKTGMSLWGFAGLMILVEALILTYSRGGLLGYAGGLIIVMFLCFRNEGFKPCGKALISAVVVSMVLLGITTISDTVYRDRIKSMIDTSAPSNQERLYLWGSALKIIAGNPLLGIGPDNFRFVYAEKYAREAPFSTLRVVNGIPSHNSNSTLLEMGASLGIPGMIVFMWFLVKMFLLTIRNYNRLRDESMKNLMLGLTGCLTVFCIHGMLDYFLGEHPISAFFWVVMAMIVALGKINEGDRQCE